MRTETHGQTLLLTDITSLTAENSRLLKELAHASLTPEHRIVDVDLSAARAVDSEGLGALISIHKTMCGRQGQVRLLNPSAFTEELVRLVRLDQILTVVRT